MCIRMNALRACTTGALAALVLLSGCSDPSDDAGGVTVSSSAAADTKSASPVATDASIAAMVPAAVRKSGRLTIATEGAYPPFELFAADNKTLIGVDPELGVALATVMGLKPNLVNVKFDAIIPGLQAKRYDVGMAAYGDTKVREKIVDFVTYFRGGSSILLPKGNPKKLTLTTLCGKRLAVQKGTIYESATVPELTKKCTAAGEPAIVSSTYPGQPEAILAVSSGRADATISDFAPMSYVAKNSKGKFEVLPQQYETIPWGIASPKGSGLAKPLQAALKKLMADGTYDRVLKKWEVTSGAIKDPVINGAVS